MTVKEMMQKLLDEDANDIDFCDDYDERAYVAYCGNHWSPKAEEKYAEGFALTVDEEYSRLDGDDRIVIVHCENSKDANALKNLLLSMAGYLESSEEYDELYPEPEIKEPERSKLEIVLVSGQIINAKWVDFDCQHGCIDVLGLDDEWYPYKMSNVLRIIGEVK